MTRTPPLLPQIIVFMAYLILHLLSQGIHISYFCLGPPTEIFLGYFKPPVGTGMFLQDILSAQKKTIFQIVPL